MENVPDPEQTKRDLEIISSRKKDPCFKALEDIGHKINGMSNELMGQLGPNHAAGIALGFVAKVILEVVNQSPSDPNKTYILPKDEETKP